jgi:hypothetical protein
VGDTATAPDFPVTESLLAPLIIGLHRDTSSTDYANLAARGAIAALPTARTQLNLLFTGNRKTQAVEHERLLFQGSDKLGNRIVRLCDRRGGETNEAAWPRWRWEISYAVLRPENGPTPIPDAQTNIRLTVSRYQLSGGRIDSPAQLALFRHLFVEGLRGIDPSLIVQGGQHDWRDAWWTVQTSS